jgi:hypothetical protein
VFLDFQPSVAVASIGNTGAFAAFNGAGATGTIADMLVGRGPQRIADFFTLGGYQFSLRSLPSGAFGQADCYVAAAVGQQCTPYQSALGDLKPSGQLSPFYLTNGASGLPGAPFTSIAAFDLVGTVRAPDGSRAAFAGTIGATFEGLSFQEVLGGLEGLGAYGLAYPAVAFTGTFVVGSTWWLDDEVDVDVTPEPGAALLAAVGLAGVGAIARPPAPRVAAPDRRRPVPAGAR